MSANDSLYILMISVHGLIRGRDLELGRDADTGGQTKYVVELAKAAAQHESVERVDLMTRLIIDSQVDQDYQQHTEMLSDNSQIIRIKAGAEEYIHKEKLWDYLDNFVDNALVYLRTQEKLPNIIHAHYADAGYVGVRLASQLGIPLAFTGHSLGRVKRRRLLASGLRSNEIEQRYNISRRIEAEEETLSMADLVVTSTHNEAENQYELYDHFQPEKMRVIPPGIDLSRFCPADTDQVPEGVAQKVAVFLRDPAKPIIFAISRADQRKNISGLLHAYGHSKALQKIANLLIVAGNREDIEDLESGAKDVLREILYLVDLYDLYGKVAYPKSHEAEEVPDFYRMSAQSKGVFVNPALTEPFGLTILEASASGLPVVATEDGGPVDILNNCHNGTLVNPLDTEAMAQAILDIVSDSAQWQHMSDSGISGVNTHYSWAAHTSQYVQQITILQSRLEGPPAAPEVKLPIRFHDRALVTDLDQSLLGDESTLMDFTKVIRSHRKRTAFAIATGRRLDSALAVIKKYKIPQPDVLITSVGTEIYYAPELLLDESWEQYIDHMWPRQKIQKLFANVAGMKLQAKEEQSKYKISYILAPELAPTLNEINTLLRKSDISVNTWMSFGTFLDIVPIRASKGFALRYISDQWNIPLEKILVTGGSGTDEDMLRGNTLSVILSNRHDDELADLTDIEPMYFATRPYSAGILEAIDYYQFFDACQPPV